MHSALIVCTSLWLGATPAPVSDSTSPSSVTPALVVQLGSSSFAARQAAMEQLWGAGDASIPLLEQALRHKNAEIRYRARFVLDHLRSGITFDTPASVLRDVYRFRSEMVEDRRQAMQRLEAAGRPRIVLSLLQSETDPRLREEWSLALERSLTRSIAAGQLDEVAETLRRSTDTDTWYRHWAAFALQRGLIDAELSRSAAPETQPDAIHQRIYLLRAKGELSEAARLAAGVSNELHLALLAELRDWKQAAPLAAARVRDESPGMEVDPQVLTVAAAYARLAGQTDESNRFLAAIRSHSEEVLGRLANLDPTFYQQQRELVNRNWHFAKGLLLNGRYDQAIDLMRSRQAPFVFELLCEQQRFEEAFAAVGSALSRGPDPDWFQQVAAESTQGQEATEQRFAVAQVVIRQLAFLGRRDEALSSLLVLLDSARNDRDTRRLRMVCETASKLQATELALQVATTIIEKEDSSSVLDLLYPTKGPLAGWWWEFFRARHADEPLLNTLQRVDELLHPSRCHQDIESLVQDAALQAAALDEDQRIEAWHQLAETCRLHSRLELARTYYTQAAAGSYDDALQLGDLFAEREEWAAATQWYHAAWQKNRSRPLPLYLYGRVLQQGGDVEKGKQVAELALLMPMGNSELRHELASGLKERGYRTEAQQQFELILRTGDFQDKQLIDAAKQVGNLIHTTDALRAADYWEMMLLCCLKPYWVFAEKGGYIQIPHLIHKTRARGFLQAGQADLAMQELWASFRAAPADSELAEEFVPLLKKANRPQDADELFAHIANRLRELSEAFPQCSTFQNNLAWLLVRCERDLNEALNHAERALELEPTRTSYVDTLAEVHFRLGHYEQAIAGAERCLKAEPRSSYYQAQFERFRKGAE